MTTKAESRERERERVSRRERKTFRVEREEEEKTLLDEKSFGYARRKEMLRGMETAFPVVYHSTFGGVKICTLKAKKE